MTKYADITYYTHEEIIEICAQEVSHFAELFKQKKFPANSAYTNILIVIGNILRASRRELMNADKEIHVYDVMNIILNVLEELKNDIKEELKKDIENE